MVPGYEYLQVLRLTRVMQELQDVRELPSELLFANRTPMTPATDGEIIGKWINRVQIADVISDDSRAVTYAAGKLATENTIIPNIKHGKHLTQEALNQLAAINQNPTVVGTPIDAAGNIIASIVDDLYLGEMQRVEQMLVAMHLDQFTYNRFGMQISGTWGIPSDLKVTPAVAWTDAANATPVNDIWAVKQVAMTRYGAEYNRLTMSSRAFRLMIATTEFQNKARVTLPLYFNVASMPQQNINFFKDVAANILGVSTIEFYDARYWSQDTGGNLTSSPYLPVTKVILGSTDNDNNPAAQDFANGIVTESVVSGMLPSTGTGMIGSFAGGIRGPVCYATVPQDLNPPNVYLWGAMRGFPRRFRRQCSAVLTVGTFQDDIAVGEPF